MKIDHTKTDTLLWGIWLSWATALASYVLHWSAVMFAAFALLLLLFLLRQPGIKKGMEMFKKKNKDFTEEAAHLADPQAAAPAENEPAATPQLARHCTVVAQNTLFTGDVKIEGDIHVYGRVVGNIILTDGILHVMRDGYIEGEFTAPNIIINGHAKGTCIGDKVEILEHGEIEGVCRSDQFSIRPGGSFIGTSERLSAGVKREMESERVVKIKKGPQDKPAEPSSAVAHALGE
jgi:cytoskeletal protein CcmA (bactofilin family)